MSVLLVQDLKKTLGAQEILGGVSLRIAAGEKVGCVGKNGAGKTTLLRLIEGEETPDAGAIVLARGARIGYVTQRPQFPAGRTVRAHVESGLAEVHAVERELAAAGEAMAEATGEPLDTLVKRHGELTARMEFLGGWESERRVETVLGGIGLAPALWDREAETLSGGEKSRTAMARELISVPDLLLLDEPTNHLDLAGIEWLEDYLRTIHSAVLMVSHDRRLLDDVVETIVEVERGRLTRFPGNYSRYVELKEERYEFARREWEQEQDYIRKEEAFIKKHIGGQRTGEAKGRRRRLQSLERRSRPYNDVRRPKITFRRVERGGEQVVEAAGLSIGYGGRPMLAGVDVRIGRGERVGVVGPNGAGKSTLLRVLAGRMAPLEGKVTRGYRASGGYFDQDTSDLREDGTPYSEIRRDHPQMTDLEIRSHLARFLFRGDEVDRRVDRLSGGERARLSLARLVLTEPSWLALDEPTNHLDLAGRTALEEMLGEFPGALVCISHDRQFLDDLVDTILEVEGGEVRTFRGNYSEYRARRAAEAAARMAEGEHRRQAEEGRRRAAAEKGRRAAEREPARGRGPRNPWAFRKLEETIIALEEERAKLLDSLGSAEVYRDGDACRETQIRLAEIERDLGEKNREWEEWG
ncbi:MAG: ABC-F family ATP-binding cassette domain-containing protein [Planctomycetota bacterium]